jgi:hypothetical protein
VISLIGNLTEINETVEGLAGDWKILLDEELQLLLG